MSTQHNIYAGEILPCFEVKLGWILLFQTYSLIGKWRLIWWSGNQNTSLAALGAFAHHLQRLQNPKWPVGGFKMADGVWNIGCPILAKSCPKNIIVKPCTDFMLFSQPSWSSSMSNNFCPKKISSKVPFVGTLNLCLKMPDTMQKTRHISDL